MTVLEMTAHWYRSDINITNNPDSAKYTYRLHRRSSRTTFRGVSGLLQQTLDARFQQRQGVVHHGLRRVDSSRELPDAVGGHGRRGVAR